MACQPHFRQQQQPAPHRLMGTGVLSIEGHNGIVSHSLVSTKSLSFKVDSGRFNGEMSFILLNNITDNADNVIADWCSALFSSSFTSIQDSKKNITLSLYNPEGCMFLQQKVHGCLIKSFRDRNLDYISYQPTMIPDNIPTVFSRRVLTEKTNKKFSNKTFFGVEFEVRFDYFETLVA